MAERLKLVAGQRKPTTAERLAARSIPGDDGRLAGQFNAAHFGRVAAEREIRRQQGLLMGPQEWKGVTNLRAVAEERPVRRWWNFWTR